MFVKQATDPNSKETFLILADDKKLVSQNFPASLYQIREVCLMPEEEDALEGCGAEVASGEITPCEALVSVMRHRMTKCVEISWDGKITVIAFR